MLSYYLVHCVWEAELYCLILSRINENNPHTFIFSILHSLSILVKKYTKAAKNLLDLHELRLQSVTAHPRNTKTGTSTRRLKHYDFYKIRPKVKDAIEEIISAVLIR
jgi:hypothetical protein